MAKLEAESRQRSDMLLSRLSVVKNQLKLEEEQLVREEADAKVAICDLSKLRKSTEKSCSVQLQMVMEETEELGRVLAEGKDNDDSGILSLKSMERNEALQRENVVLTRRIKQLEDEIAKLEGEVDLGQRELKRSLTPKRPAAVERRYNLGVPFRYSVH
jgi:hypothetical protein